MTNPVDQPKGDLLPCPGCERSVNEPHDTDGDGVYFVDCAHCGWRGPRAYNLTDASNRWNRRAARPQATTDNPILPDKVLADNHARALKADGASGSMTIDTSVVIEMIGEIYRSRSALIGIPGAEKGETLGLTDFAVGTPVRTPGRKIKGIVSDLTVDGRAFVDYPAGGGKYWPLDQLQSWNGHRDDLGRQVRAAWIKWAMTQPAPKASWLVPYDQLSEPDKEADRQIGEAIALYAAPTGERVQALTALKECAAEDFEGSKGISVYAAATNELKRRTEIARAALKATPRTTDLGSGETGPGDDEIEIEITTRMIAAGVSALYGRDWGDEPGEWAVERVYRKMELARVGPRQKST